MNNTFDVAVIGAGVAGAFATYRLVKEHKGVKTLVIDIGRPWQKRKRQTEGWLGSLPSSDGKLYINDVAKVADLIGSRKSNSINKWVLNTFGDVADIAITKDKKLSASLEKKVLKSGYQVTLNDFIQIYPKDIHALSKMMSSDIENSKNVTCSFDNEVLSITKQKNMFCIQTSREEFKCKKILLAVGRSGWRWAADLFNKFGIIENDDFAKFGIRAEIPASYLKDFNKSNCLLHKENLEIGPFSWFGTIIPEDHLDGLAISAFRSNENRWKTEKVSFPIMGNIFFNGKGFEQTDRIGKLTFLLGNDRILKEKISTLMSDRSKISILNEYSWLKEELKQLSEVIPNILTKAYFHVPTITPLAPKINLGNNLESEIPDLYVAGESSGIIGILAAANMGCAAIDNICK